MALAIKCHQVYASKLQYTKRITYVLLRTMYMARRSLFMRAKIEVHRGTWCVAMPAKYTAFGYPGYPTNPRPIGLAYVP